MMRYQFIKAQKAKHNIGRLCNLLKVSRAGFYAWVKRKPSQRQRDDMVLLVHIRSQFEASLRSYGRPRMVEELREQGFAIGHTRVGRLMRENGLSAIRTRKARRHHSFTPTFGFAPNLLEQDFTVRLPDRKWSADITYVATGEGWLYLAVVIDLYSRRVVGWAVSDRMKKDLALRALRMALAIRQPAPGLIHHSDRGSQYCAAEYQMLLKQHYIKISMSGKGNCYDNAPVESFFKTLKSELVWRTKLKTRYQAERVIMNYINLFYNVKRRHSALGNISPMQYEKIAA